MKIYITSVFVDDQDKALDFYTNKLGFVKKNDVPVGEFRWLTVVSPEGSGDIELLLEPNANEASKTYQSALYQQGIPAASFLVDHIQDEFEKLSSLGVMFAVEPAKLDNVTTAVFDDTCGNLIQIVQIDG